MSPPDQVPRPDAEPDGDRPRSDGRAPDGSAAKPDGAAPGKEGDEAAEPLPDGGVSAVFIRRPVTTFMMMAGLLIVGLIAYFQVPIASLPTVDVATVLVTAQLSGADPQTNAFAVTNPLETQFGQIPGLATMTSASANSYAEITLFFGFNRTVESAAQDAQRAINGAAAFSPPPCAWRWTRPSSPTSA